MSVPNGCIAIDGDYLRLQMALRGWSQADMCRQAVLSPVVVSRVLRRGYARTRTFERIAAALEAVPPAAGAEALVGRSAGEG